MSGGVGGLVEDMGEAGDLVAGRGGAETQHNEDGELRGRVASGRFSSSLILTK